MIPSHSMGLESDTWKVRYRNTRERTESLCAPLEPDDHGIQTMPDVSPPKWHLAHTTWFFETFLLAPNGIAPYHEKFGYLFNSYYKGLGPHHPRLKRGLLSRPTLAEVFQYRAHVDEEILGLLNKSNLPEGFLPLLELGLNHEQQHQELLLADIKHIFFMNPLRPAYRPIERPPVAESKLLTWLEISPGLREIGHEGDHFSFDNERPRHRVFLEGCRIASRLVTNEEYLGFMEEGGYEEPRLWLSDGWDSVLEHSWEAPLYWEKDPSGRWRVFTLEGPQDLDPEEPVSHISFYEAEAFARWAGMRLPTEAEWEAAVVSGPLDQALNKLWQWTGSSYVPYPGFRPDPGDVSEYNGKFMCNQMVLRGGSYASPIGHVRPTYRNFFPPHARWQFSGIRLAKDSR